MPIPPQYSWKQTDDAVEVTAQIRGVDRKLLNQLQRYTITPIFFSFNAPPYLFQLDFAQEIDTFGIKIEIIDKNDIHFVFPKKDRKIQWQDLVTNKPKEQRLKNRMQSIDELYAKQKEIREQREKQRKLRFKAAQQRQWDQDKYLKKIINRLESNEKEQETQKLEQWVDDTAKGKCIESTSSTKSNTVDTGDSKDEPDKEEEEEEKEEEDEEEDTTSEMDNVRTSTVVEVGFTKWDYITPIREHSKPPQFASKTMIQSIKKNGSKIEEITPIFLCDKGIKFFMNGDCKSAINAFNESIALDPEYLEALCSRFQCQIEILDGELKDMEYDEDDIKNDLVKMESIASSDRYQDIVDFVNMIIALQKGTISTIILLDKLRNNHDKSGREERIQTIKAIQERGLKMYSRREATNVLENTFGIFKLNRILHGLKQSGTKYNTIVSIVEMKQKADILMREERCAEAVNLYTDILTEFEKDSDNDFPSFLKMQSLNNRSAAYYNLNQFTECIADCDRLIECNKEHVNAFARRGAAYLSLGKKDGMQRKHLEKALESYTLAAELKESYRAHKVKIEKILMSIPSMDES